MSWWLLSSFRDSIFRFCKKSFRRKTLKSIEKLILVRSKLWSFVFLRYEIFSRKLSITRNLLEFSFYNIFLFVSFLSIDFCCKKFLAFSVERALGENDNKFDVFSLSSERFESSNIYLFAWDFAESGRREVNHSMCVKRKLCRCLKDFLLKEIILPSGWWNQQRCIVLRSSPTYLLTSLTLIACIKFSLVLRINQNSTLLKNQISIKIYFRCRTIVELTQCCLIQTHQVSKRNSFNRAIKVIASLNFY